MFETVRLRPAVQPVAQAAGETMPPANRKIENLILVIFWLLLLEGALRKWVAPQLSQYIFFIRDPFVLLLYWHALRAGAFRNQGLLFQAGLAFAVCAIFLAFIQSISFGNPRMFIVTIYGWRQYFLYLPLPFVMAATLNADSLVRVARHALVAAILMAPLVFMQFQSSPSAIINRGIADDESLQFRSMGLGAGTIRPSGSFTSNVGVGNLIPSSLAFLLSMWLMPARGRRFGTVFLLLAAAGIATCLALSGSRGAFVHSALVFLSAILAGAVSRNAGIRTRAVMIPVAALLAGVVLYPLVFPDALEAMLARVQAASASEAQVTSFGLFGRAFYDAIGFVSAIGTTPLTGFGLGLGGNGRTFLGPAIADIAGNIYAESEWSRHIIDLGSVVGVLFIAYRIVFTVVLLQQSVAATRATGNPLPVLLFGYVGVGLFFSQLTGHGTIGGFIWLYLGLCMAACRTGFRPR